MKKQKNIFLKVPIFLFVILLFCQTLVLGADVPQAVLDARQGVVRIISEYSDGLGTGTGFAVGDDSQTYIITNYHVIEDAKEVLIYYDTDKYVRATVVAESTGKDLAVLRPSRYIPGLKILPLQTAEFDSGLSVYALGYPFAADTLALDFESIENFEDLKLDSSKGAITITDGIISALRESPVVGDKTRPVKTIQTNTSISSGNSGGPLVDKDGNVVGINTMGSMFDANINASVHVAELTAFLKSENISYNEPVAITDSDIAVEEPVDTTFWVVIAGVGVAVVSIIAAIIVHSASKKKQKNTNQGVSLNNYYGGGQQ